MTTVHVPMYDVGARATQLLVEQIESPEYEPEHIVLSTTLVVRESSGIAPVLA